MRPCFLVWLSVCDCFSVSVHVACRLICECIVCVSVLVECACLVVCMCVCLLELLGMVFVTVVCRLVCVGVVLLSCWCVPPNVEPQLRVVCVWMCLVRDCVCLVLCACFYVYECMCEQLRPCVNDIGCVCLCVWKCACERECVCVCARQLLQFYCVC